MTALGRRTAPDAAVFDLETLTRGAELPVALERRFVVDAVIIGF